MLHTVDAPDNDVDLMQFDRPGYTFESACFSDLILLDVQDSLRSGDELETFGDQIFGEKTAESTYTYYVHTGNQVGFIPDLHASKTNFDPIVLEDIREIFEKNQVIVFTGDLADFWIDNFFETPWYPYIYSFVEDARARGKDVFFVYGNHDSPAEWEHGRRKVQGTVDFPPFTSACHELRLLYEIVPGELVLPFKVSHGHEYSPAFSERGMSRKAAFLSNFRVISQASLSIGMIFQIDEYMELFGKFLISPHENFHSQIQTVDGSYNERSRRYISVTGHTHHALFQPSHASQLFAGQINVGDCMPSNSLLAWIYRQYNMEIRRHYLQVTPSGIFMHSYTKQPEQDPHLVVQTALKLARTLLGNNTASQLIVNSLLSTPVPEPPEEEHLLATPQMNAFARMLQALPTKSALTIGAILTTVALIMTANGKKLSLQQVENQYFEES